MSMLGRVFASRGLLSGSAGSLVIKTISLFLALAVSVTLAKLMGPRNFGIYIMVWSTVMLLSIPLTMGLPTLIVRNVPAYEADLDYSAIRGLIVKAHQFLFFSYLLFIGLGLLFYVLFKSDFSDDFWGALFWAAWLLLFMGLNAVRCAVLEGFRYVVLGQLPDLILRNILIIVSVCAVSMYTEINPENAMMLHALSALAAYFFGVLLAKYKVGAVLKGDGTKYYSKDWFSQGAAYSVNSGINNLKARISIYALAAVQGPEAVGIFEVALKFANFVSFSLTAINKALAPYIVRAYRNTDMEELQRILKKSSRFMFFMAIPVVIAFLFWGENLITRIYGDQYSLASTPLIIISIGQLINSFTGSVGLFLLMANQQRFVLKINLSNTVFNIIAAIILTIHFSLVGAAIAYASLLVIQNIIFVLYTRKIFGLSTTAI